MYKYLSSLAILIFLVSFASASSHNIELNQVDNTLLVKHSIAFDSEQEISITLPADASSISSNVQYTLRDNVLNAKGKDIEISYLTYSSLEKSDEGYYLIDTLKLDFPADTVEVKLILKEGYYLDKEKIFPRPSQIGTDGEQIFLVWSMQETKAGDDLPLFVEIKSRNSGWAIWLTWILGIVVGVLVLFFVYDKIISRFFKKPPRKEKRRRRSRAEKEEKAEEAPIESHLIESEKAVISLLKQADRGEMWQRELQTKTGFSKAKLSRVVRNLEARNLVDKVPFGNTNKIRLL